MTGISRHDTLIFVRNPAPQHRIPHVDDCRPPLPGGNPVTEATPLPGGNPVTEATPLRTRQPLSRARGTP